MVTHLYPMLVYEAASQVVSAALQAAASDLRRLHLLCHHSVNIMKAMSHVKLHYLLPLQLQINYAKFQNC